MAASGDKTACKTCQGPWLQCGCGDEARDKMRMHAYFKGSEDGAGHIKRNSTVCATLCTDLGGACSVCGILDDEHVLISNWVYGDVKVQGITHARCMFTKACVPRADKAPHMPPDARALMEAYVEALKARDCSSIM